MAPRFHLSTLLLLCVFAGAVMGIYLDSEYWKLETSKRIDLSIGPPYIQIGKDYPWIYGAEEHPGLNAKYVRFSEESLEVAMFESGGNSISISHSESLKEPVKWAFTITAPERIRWIKYSPDAWRIAIASGDNMMIYRRTRAYGFWGYLRLPLFWIALVSLLGLCAAFVRWMAPNPLSSATTGPSCD